MKFMSKLINVSIKNRYIDKSLSLLTRSKCSELQLIL